MLVRQAANVLELLEYFAERKRPSALPEISSAMGWPRSSTHNLLTTLTQLGFLYEPRPRAGYYPSTQWITLVRRIAEAELLPDDLTTALAEIAEATGETAAIAAPARTSVVFLEVVESPAAVRFAAKVGDQVPIHATASGRALLEQYSTRERASILKKVSFEQYAHRSPMTAEQVETQIERAITRGWHENVEGHAADLTGVAIPVGLNDRPLSVVVGGPSSRMRKRIPAIAEILRKTLKRHGFSGTS